MLIKNCSVVLYGHRIHHFAVGIGLGVAGALLMLDDWADMVRWIRRVMRVAQ